jgi:hypothetical protein
MNLALKSHAGFLASVPPQSYTYAQGWSVAYTNQSVDYSIF